VIAHHGVPDAPGEKMRWLQRHVAFMTPNGVSVATRPRPSKQFA